MTIRLDYSNMIDAPVSGAIPEAEWKAAPARFREVFAAFQAQRKTGDLGFLDLPGNAELAGQITKYAASVKGKFDDVVVLGIGGSALGPIALRTALRPAGWNGNAKVRGGWPRMHVLDNVDPRTIKALLAELDLTRALFVVTSKSGGTAETMSQFLIIRERLKNTVGDKASEHIVFITDPKKGALREIANAEKIPALDIPSNVGGRFSVLTAVGLLPAALIGIDIGAILKGAADMAKRCETDDLLKNPAGCWGMLQYLADAKAGKHIHVLMPYADALRDFADWYVQLWAESLGKHRRSDQKPVGPTPLGALGATDQHSKVQLFMEGPADKTITMISLAERPDDLTIPKDYAKINELGYLGGHTLAELIEIECRATGGALARRGRPNMTFRLDRVDEEHVGGLMMLLEIATIYAGTLYDVNPLDQPGVELGKQFAYAQLGRADADAARKEWEQLPKADPSRSV